MLEGFGLAGKAPVCLKASARWCLVSPLSILSAFVYRKRLQQRVGRYLRTGLTPHQSERLKFCYVLISVNCSFVSHLSFTAPIPLLHCLEGFSAAANFLTLALKWRSITVKGQWLCPPQGRATYTAEPVLWLQVCRCCCCCCWSGVTWML